MQMRDRISAFLEEKQGLSVNSKAVPISMIWNNFRFCRQTDFWDQSQDLPSPTNQSKNQRPEAKDFGL